MWGLLSWWGRELRLSLGSPQGIQTSLHLVRWKTTLHSSHCREIQAYFESGHLGVHSIWAANSGYLLHNYSWEKPPLEVLVESWHSSWVKARQSALISRWFGVYGAFLELLYWTWCSSRLGTMFSVNLWSCLGGVKPLVVFDGEHEMAVEPMQGNQASSWVDLWCTELFCVAVGTLGSL